MNDSRDLHSQSGIPLSPVYRPEGSGAPAYDRDLGDPGDYPYTRGPRPVASGADWIQRELSGEGGPHRSNEQFKALIDAGATGLDIIGDAATMACIDPDHPMASASVGTTGVSLCRLDDFIDLYDKIPLDEVTVSHSLYGPLAIPALFLAARHHGFDPKVVRGSMIQAPLFGEDCGYAVHLPTELRVRLSLDSIEFATREMPRFHPYLEDTYFISDGSLDSVDEMAFGFVEIRELCRRLVARGLDIDAFARRIAILVNCRMDVFEEIAKIRATRRMFARLMREEFGAADPRTLAVNIAVHTSGMSLTSQQPINNVIRGAVQGFAMGLAGVQALEISTFDEGYRTPSEDAHLVALRTQQILRDEVEVGRVADPLGGSWYVEALTDELESRITARVDQIEAMGDLSALVDQGWFRSVFLENMEARSNEVQSGERTVVGLNRYVVDQSGDRLLREIAEQRIEPDSGHLARIVEWRRSRDRGAVDGALIDVKEAVQDSGQELMAPILIAIEAGTTFGELIGAMREACGLRPDPMGVR